MVEVSAERNLVLTKFVEMHQALIQITKLHIKRRVNEMLNHLSSFDLRLPKRY